MGTRTEASFCRTCGGLCGVDVTVDDAGRLVSVQGDRNNPLTQGFACIKGLQAPAFHNHPDRLLHPLKRQPDGSFQRISLEQALDEIAARVDGIIEEDGGRAVATFRGTQNYTDTLGYHMLPAWSAAIDSTAFFSTMTIDQSAKWVTAERLGFWGAGYQPFADSDVWMFVGINPVVSLWGGNAFSPFNPVKQLKAAKARGATIIVIDPRHTETARFADIHLQPRPGEDVTVAAGLVRLILAENWHDREFCDRHVAGLDALAAAVAPYTPDYVEARADVPPDMLRLAAAAFARDGRRGACTTGTGPNMGPRSNLADHLYECLNVICGRFLRAGEVIPNPGVMGPRRELSAEVVPPGRSWEQGPRSRVGGVGMLQGQMMSGVLVDEILTPGEGRIRALFVAAGNPAMAFPNQKKTVDALRGLDLLVAIEPMMTATARLAHYILPPRLQYERYDLPLPHYEGVFPGPYAQYTPAVATPPEGSEVVDDWYVFWALAKRMGRAIQFDGEPLNMESVPHPDELLAILIRNAAVPFETIRSQRQGDFLDVPAQTVAPAREGRESRFEVAPADIVEELALVGGEEAPADGFTHRLVSRRMRELQNTLGMDLPAIRARRPFNPAYMHPSDMTAHQLAEDDVIEIISRAGAISGRVQGDESVRPGAISMTHCWGVLPGDPDDGSQGASTSLLVSTDVDVEPINAMPVMSAIPVRIRKMDVAETA